MMRVLAIDGGGIRGIIPAAVLSELERRTERRICDLFDVVVGTSTGGILALASTCPLGGHGPRSAAEIGDIYVERGELIFPLGDVAMVGLPPRGSRLFGVRTPLPAGSSLGDRFKNLMGYPNIAKVVSPLGGGAERGNARYPTKPLEDELRRQLGEELMSNAVRPVAIVSCDFETAAPLVFRGGGLDQAVLGDAKMWHAARATSAGPTFFQTFSYRGADGVVRRCVDGGLIANDPAFVAYTEAVSLLRAAGRAGEEILLVSVGTGAKAAGAPPEGDVASELLDRRAWPQLAPSLLGAMSGGGGELMRQQLAQLLGSDYVRLQTVVDADVDHAMDNASPANVAALRRTAARLVAESSTVLSRLASIL